MMTYKTRTWKGRKLACPRCRHDVKYWLSRNDVLPAPFFHCDRCNNFLERASDRHSIPGKLLGLHGHNRQLHGLFEAMLRSAPICPCGGHFTFWANVKCPNCWYEFPWTRDEVKDELDARVHAGRIVIIDGAIARSPPLVDRMGLTMGIKAKRKADNLKIFCTA
jgi:hypothetical protein